MLVWLGYKDSYVLAFVQREEVETPYIYVTSTRLFGSKDKIIYIGISGRNS